MSSFRAVLIGLMFAGLAACGFQPLYGDKSGGRIDDRLADIRIQTIEDRVGQILHNLLLDRINPYGRPADPLYTLRVRAAVSKAEIGLKFTEVATRARLTLSASFQLIEDESGDVVASGQVRSVNSYNISDSEFARVASENDATERAAREVSEEIRTRLSLFFNRKAS